MFIDQTAVQVAELLNLASFITFSYYFIIHHIYVTFYVLYNLYNFSWIEGLFYESKDNLVSNNCIYIYMYFSKVYVWHYINLSLFTIDNNLILITG